MDSPESEEEGRFVDYFAVCGLDPLDGVEPNELTGRLTLYSSLVLTHRYTQYSNKLDHFHSMNYNYSKYQYERQKAWMQTVSWHSQYVYQLLMIF